MRTCGFAAQLKARPLAINHGAAFGLGASSEPILTAAAFGGVILLGTWAARCRPR